MKSKSLSILLIILSLVLLSYSISQVKIVYGYYGMLLHSFPISFPISLAILVVASFIFWSTKTLDYKIALLSLFIFIFSIWLLPQLLEPEGLISSQAGTFYGMSGLSYYIESTGHFNPRIEGHHMACPATWILYTAIFEVCDIERPRLIFILTPWLFVAFYLLFLIPFFRKNLEGNLWLFTLWIFFIGNFIGYELFAAYSYSYLLFFLFVYLLSKVEDQSKASTGMRALFIITLASSVIYHGLISTLFLFLLIAFYLVKKIDFRLLSVTLAVFIGAWAIYIAWPDLQNRLPDIMDRFLRFDIMYHEAYEIRGPRFPEELAFRFYTKFYTIIAFLALGTFGALLNFSEKILKGGKKFFTMFSTEEKTFIALSVGIIAHGLIIGLTYHAEFPARFYLTLLPCASYFGTKLLTKKTLALLLLVFLILAIPPHLIGRYAFRPESLMPYDIAPINFFHDHVTCENSVVGGYEGNVGGYVQDITLNEGGHFYDELNWNDKTSMLALGTKKQFYVFLGEFDRVNYEGFGKPSLVLQTEEHLNEAKNGGLIYTDGSEKMNIYAFENPFRLMPHRLAMAR